MPQIFLSWSTPDNDIVSRLIERLYDLGLGTADDLELPTLWQYRREMNPGDNIPGTVKQAIRESDVAVMCLSDEALGQPWIISEATLIFSAKDDGTLRKVIPVKVGPTAPDSLKKIQHIASFPDDFLADVSAGSEDDLAKLGKAIMEGVRKKLPKVVPIAVIAMVESQAVELFKELTDHWKEKAQSFWELCRAVGMENPPGVLAAFRKRYNSRPEDIRPFKSCADDADPSPSADAGGLENDSLRDIIHESLRIVNAARVKRDERPIFPRWIQGELFGSDSQAQYEAERLWTSHDSLLVIDQISLFHEDVLKQLAALPPASESSRIAALCLPPYTQHTHTLEEYLGTLADEFPDLRYLFNEWNNTERMISFDTATSVTLRLWLHRRFVTVPDKDPPVGAKVRSMPPSRRNAPRQMRSVSNR